MFKGILEIPLHGNNFLTPTSGSELISEHGIKSYDRFTESMTQQVYKAPKSPEGYLSRLKEFESVVRNVYEIERMPGVDREVKEESVREYLENKVGRFDDILEDYGIDAKNVEEKYLALSHIGALLEDDLETGYFSKEGIGKEVNLGLEKYRAERELVLRGLYEEKDGKLERTSGYSSRKRDYSWSEIRRLEKKAGVGSNKLKAVGASLVMLGAAGLAGCIGQNNSQSNSSSNQVSEKPHDNDELPDQWEMKYFGNLKQYPSDDPDHDYVDNYFEWKYGTDPTTPYTFKGIDDFNLIYTYPHYFTTIPEPDDFYLLYIHPDTSPNIIDKNLTQKEINEFLKNIPNVEPRCWTNTDGSYHATYEDGKYINVSLKDPLVKYYAKKVNIEWYNNSIYGKVGELKLDDEPLYLGYGVTPTPPVCYLTHGRRGICVNTAIAHAALLISKGYKCTMASSDATPEDGVDEINHEFLEADINGDIYVVNFNKVIPRMALNGKTFYELVGWKLSSDYDPNWAKNTNYKFM